ncbi:MAG: hypothetical protein LWW77_11515 [Propionibacteriales bacterium]|jgi:hypothetical protein|nr:hypothetical protein [Propionibacteriales bacterium]
MHYFVRIGGMIISVLVGSAALAVGLTWALAAAGITLGISVISVFVGFLFAGLVGAVLARDSWFYA